MTATTADTAFTVGSEIGVLELGPISRTTLALFAGASNDHNPIHIDLDVAKSAGLDDVFAHGMLSMAYLARAVQQWIGPRTIRSLGVRFVAITPVHGAPTFRGVVTAIREDTGTELATIDVTTTLADGTVTLRGTAVVETKVST